jgi:transcription elongation factor Elf1
MLKRKVGTQMRLVPLEPDAPDHEKRTFQCPLCKHLKAIPCG